MHRIIGVMMLSMMVTSPEQGFASERSLGVNIETTQQHKKHRCYKVRGKKYCTLPFIDSYKKIGKASWYGYESGKRTASGKRFNPLGLSAAHKILPLFTKVKVTNLRNNKSVILVINDRGPFVKDRIIDLSLGAARKIGLKGVETVKIEVI